MGKNTMGELIVYSDQAMMNHNYGYGIRKLEQLCKMMVV
jgi:hypothetical protein